MLLENETTHIEKQVNFSDLATIFTKYKYRIFVANFIIVLVSLVIAFTLPNYYTSSAILKVAKNSSQNNSQSNLSSALGGLGLTTSSSDQILAMQTIKSRDILNSVLKKNNLREEKENKFPVKALLNNSIDDESFTFTETYESFRDALSVTPIESDFLEISVTHNSPDFAYYLLNLVINETNSILRTRSMQKSEKAIEFLASRRPQAASLELQKSIGNLTDFHLRNLTLANIDDEYSLQVINSPFLPEEKSGPYRKLVFMVGIFFGLILTILFLLFAARFSTKKTLR